MESNIHYIKGDIFKQDVDIVGHQTNCLGIMGGGIAWTVRAKYPTVYQEYAALCKQYKGHSSDMLGICQIVPTGNGRIGYIANLFGEDVPTGTRVDTDYDALRKALTDLHNRVKGKNLTVGLPYKIGCGLAGGDWNIVDGIIHDVFEGDETTNVLICEL